MDPISPAQNLLDQRNQNFWNELCGSSFARHLGITDHTATSLKRFDDAYFELYPYLRRHVPVETFSGKAVLEIGLGYGALGQCIAEAGARYTAMDIATGPGERIRHRLHMHSLPGKVIQGSMLECPLPDASQDCVVSIGCFHHTGDVQRCFDETWRVLKPGGTAYLMVYNQLSYRQWLRWPVAALRAYCSPDVKPDSTSISVAQKAAYDPDLAGRGAPETIFLSSAQVRHMLSRFSRVQIAKENCLHVTFRGRTLFPRWILLASLGRGFGLDLYIAASK